MANKIIKAGIAGMGRSGYLIHARCLLQSPGKYSIVAVAEGRRDMRTMVSGELNCRAYRTHAELMADPNVELFINAMPNHLHVEASVDALKAGLHVVCDKPIAADVQGIDRMIAASRASRRVFAPFHNLRFTPSFTKIQEVIASGVLGRILHVRIDYSSFKRRWDWQTLQKYDGGNMNVTGSHLLDHAMALFGRSTPRVFSRLLCGPNSAGDADDFAAVTLHAPGAPLIEIVASSYQAYPSAHNYVISGTQGGLAGDTSELQWRYYDSATAPKMTLQRGWAAHLAYCNEELPWTERKWKLRRHERDIYAYPVKLYYDHLYEVLTGKARLVVTPAQVRRQIAVLQEIHHQNRLPRRY